MGKYFDSDLLFQICLLTDQGQKYADNWAKILGEEIRELDDSGTFEDCPFDYKGRKITNAGIKSRNFEFPGKDSSIQFEVIEPYGEMDEWNRYVSENGTGLHHIAFFVKDLDTSLKSLEELDIYPIQYGAPGAASRARYAYIDCKEKLGVTIELYQFGADLDDILEFRKLNAGKLALTKEAGNPLKAHIPTALTILCEDIDQRIEVWGKLLQQMPLINETVDHSYRRVCFRLTNTRLELIKPLDDKSVYGQSKQDAREGLFSITYSTDDVKRDSRLLLDFGLQTVIEDEDYIFFDASDTLGCNIELRYGEIVEEKQEENKTMGLKYDKLTLFRDIMGDEHALSILEKHIPGFRSKIGDAEPVKNMPLYMIFKMGKTSDEEIVKIFTDLNGGKDDNSLKNALGNEKKEKPLDSNVIARKYLDRLRFELSHIGTSIPDAGVEFFGEQFNTPLTTCAFSHLRENMIELANGVKQVGALYFLGTSTDEEVEKIIATGVKVATFIKPYADNAEILRKIQHDKNAGAIAIGMDIDHAFNKYGEHDIVDGAEMAPKSAEELKTFVEAAAPLPFIVKGVLGAKDALICKEIGVRGIVVSHHHGIIDSCVAPVEILPDIRAAVGKDMTIFVDCSIDDGYDAFKALALGADGACLSRKILPTLRENGARGVSKYYEEMTRQFKAIMCRTGYAKVSEIDDTCIRKS